MRDFISAIEDSLSGNSFVKLTLGAYKGAEMDLKNIYVRRITIKQGERLSFTYRYRARDIVKNYEFDEALQKIRKNLNHGFSTATLMTTGFDMQMEKGKVKTLPPSHTELPDTHHDRAKHRHVETANRPYLTALGITDESGQVLKSAQDKYRQIDKYVEIVGGLIQSAPKGKLNRIIDMGAGKGYLTFALYDYLANALKLDIDITGVEMRSDLVNFCNAIAQNAAFEKLSFVDGTIENYDAAGADVLIALHACDTATDEAIHKGIEANAQIIILAPCCHKQVRREIEQGGKKNDLEFLTRHGIFLERQAEMVTDGLRALMLEYAGYSTKIFEFVGGEHTPKNIMIVATRASTSRNPAVLERIKAAKAYFGIGTHALEKLMKI